MSNTVTLRVSDALLTSTKWEALREDRSDTTPEWTRILNALDDAPYKQQGRGVVYTVTLSVDDAMTFADECLYVWEYEGTDAYGAEDRDYSVARSAARVVTQVVYHVPQYADSRSKDLALFARTALHRGALQALCKRHGVPQHVMPKVSQ